MRMIAIHNLFAAPLYSLYYQGMLLIWCTVENHLALIIVCLPAVKAALVTAAPSLSGTPSSLWSRIMGRKSSSSRLPLSNSDATRSQASSKKAKSWFSSWTSSDDTTTMTGKSRGSIGAGTELASRLPVGGRSTVVAGVHDHVHLGASDEIELRKDVYVCVSDDGGRFNDEDNDSLSSPRSFVSGKSPV
ncbi:hypothetical protein ANO11243_090810 [Dothideomycetidae sp. 11243]|nr:hypothetical protein ANO11243_090810 [fungal sp. No.11243]